MNTNLILVTNVPKSMKQYDLVKDLENKWARVIFIDNPYADLFDAFIYNPTSLLTHFEMGVAKLRNKVIDGAKPLKVYHIWFPPPNVCLTNLIPDNSTMLPFLFVDNLPKDCESYEVVGDLPFQQNEVKHWDVPQKEDKWMILRLPVNQDDAIRDYVLKYIRSRRLSNGLFPRVLEVFVTEDSRLSTSMMPKLLSIMPITYTYRSNLLFLYDLPTRLTVKGIVDACKALGVKGCRTFFIDVVNSLRVGFLIIPRSLPDSKFVAFEDGLKEKEILMEGGSKVMLNLNEVWLQPKGAKPPKVYKSKDDDRNVEYVLTNYIYIYNVAACIDHNQLTKGAPINFKVYLFQISENMTQVGFVCLRGFSDEKIVQLVGHLRSLNFEGFQVMVDNIFVKCFDLPEDHSERRTVHVPRIVELVQEEALPSNDGEPILVEGVDFGMTEEEYTEYVSDPSIEIAEEPPEELMLMKSDFIFVDNLPEDCESRVFSHIDVDEENMMIMTADDHKVAFLYYPDTTSDAWMKMLERLVMRKIRGNIVDISEVYLQSEETVELIERGSDWIMPSKYAFVYNISDSSDTKVLDDNSFVVRHSMMSTESGSCGFVELLNDLSASEIVEALDSIRSISQKGKKLCADLVWFGKVKVKSQDSTSLRSRWLKKSGPPKKKARAE